MKREAGILLPISSLPSKYGVGCFSEEAYHFVDFLQNSGQRIWQILPLCPTSFGDSPYQSPCSFAGNPYFISPDRLVGDGLLTEEECLSHSAEIRADRVDYGLLYEKRYPLLRLAFERFSERDRPDGYDAFLVENSYWLYDHALYMAIKTHLGGLPLSEWSPDLRLRGKTALSEYGERVSRETEFYIFLQYEFFTQWSALKNYANQRGVRILGDIPIYVCADSSDVWVSPHLFSLDEKGVPLSVAGCPPDAFSEKGQLWGNPLYDWNAHRESGYEWWVRRIAHALTTYDILRIDHFRGFESYYSIPHGAPDATSGHWERGVGNELFDVIRKKLGKNEIVAEDLGYITDGVRRLVKDCGFLGMKIVQFGFDGGDMDFSSEYLPHNYATDTVVYTGTHDNPTLTEWLSGLSEGQEAMLRRYICDTSTPRGTLSDKLISLAMQSVSRICIIPMQDYLGIGKEGRMNTPASASGNWEWRLTSNMLTDELSERIKGFTRSGGRL